MPVPVASNVFTPLFKQYVPSTATGFTGLGKTVILVSILGLSQLIPLLVTILLTKREYTPSVVVAWVGAIEVPVALTAVLYHFNVPFAVALNVAVGLFIQ